MFGKRNISSQIRPITSSYPIDSDGRRRIFGEKVFHGPHGNMLRELGFNLNDESNIIVDDAEFNRKISQSVENQEARRRIIEDDMLKKHGYNAIRPFFVLTDAVFSGPRGQWLIRGMKLLPYDEWNVIYLPLDRATQKAMGGDLPLHPCQSIGPIDELMQRRIETMFQDFLGAKKQIDAHVQKVGFSAAMDVLDKFVSHVDDMKVSIVDYVAGVKPLIVKSIAEVQNQAT
jgi:hypothetical protein